MTSTPDWVAGVLAFWFDTLDPRDWWRAAPAVDAEVATRFGALHRRLVACPPSPASLDADGHVAAVLVFDQFPRHLHRGRAEAFASDALALAVALDAIDRGLDAGLPAAHRQMLYMPLMHAEDAAIQQRSVERFTMLGDADALRHAKHHRATIERFGRFPTRDAALGRAGRDPPAVGA